MGSFHFSNLISFNSSLCRHPISILWAFLDFFPFYLPRRAIINPQSKDKTPDQLGHFRRILLNVGSTSPAMDRFGVQGIEYYGKVSPPKAGVLPSHKTNKTLERVWRKRLSKELQYLLGNITHFASNRISLSLSVLNIYIYDFNAFRTFWLSGTIFSSL
jgi:hypothetical protein